MQFQTTLASTIHYAGIGLHSGRNVNLTLKPAAVDSGIIFVRTDLPNAPQVKACATNVTSTQRATTLACGSATVVTVEHVLAALSAEGVDNCYVELDAPEPPVADGSSLVFVDLIRQAKIVCQERPVVPIVIKQALAVRLPDKFIAIMPYDGFRVTFTSLNPHPLLGVQFGDYEITAASFYAELAPARTIGFMHEVAALQAQGLALGGSLDNALVYDDEKALVPPRFPDELVRHKILDVIGDLSLAGRVRGHVVAVKSSHALNTELAKQIYLAGSL